MTVVLCMTLKDNMMRNGSLDRKRKRKRKKLEKVRGGLLNICFREQKSGTGRIDDALVLCRAQLGGRRKYYVLSRALTTRLIFLASSKAECERAWNRVSE
jgi:hypothetical protein